MVFYTVVQVIPRVFCGFVMISSSVSVILLCWILALGPRGTEAQGHGGGGSVSSAYGNVNLGGGSGRFGKSGRRFGHKSVFRDGGHFRSGRNGGQQGGDQIGTNHASGEVHDEDTVVFLTSSSLTTLSMPLETSAAPASVPSEITTLLETTSSLQAVSPTPTETFEQRTSIADAFPKPHSSPATLVGIPYVAPSITDIVQSLSSLPVPAPYPALNSPSSLTTTRLTVTSSTTVYVNFTPLPLPPSVAAEADSSASTQATQAPSLDFAPLPASSVKPLSAGEKAGVGVGITLATLAIVSTIAYKVYRRRQMKARESLGKETGTQNGSPPRGRVMLTSAFTSFFGPRNNREPKHDPEWRVESAEKVSILRIGSVKSVESHARAMTPPLPSLPSSEPRPALSHGETGLLKVGITVPERKQTPILADMALRSNPPVSPSSLPSPPRAGKTESWPLPE
ncbi:hypothetical protein PMIN06_005456 [Paraphaeosphaeria minitans]